MANNLRLGWPNRLTIGRMLLVGPFVVCLLNLDEPTMHWARWLAVTVFAMMALSDMLDGYLARRLHDQSDLGKFLDPVADKLLITTTVLILAIVGVPGPEAGEDAVRYLPEWVAVTAVGKDLVVCIGFAVIYLVTGRPFIKARMLGKWCTTVQLLLVLAMLLWLDLPGWLGWLPRVLWISATVLAVSAALDYIRLGTRHLAQATLGGGPPESGD
ncbi:MAG: CDP-alcohol phosphatidyltransferase family protein [Phycisphaerae bacterium]